MIVYHVTMQGREDAVPKEVAAWLVERNSLYPNIDFSVDCWVPHPAQIEEAAKAARKYERLYHLKSANDGVLTVSFPFLQEWWQIRIIGGLDKDGNILDRSKAGLTSEAEKLNEKLLVILRKDNNPVLEKPTEMVSIPPDFRWTSEVTMSGEQLNDLLSDPEVKEQASQAIWGKDWRTLKRLKDRKVN